MPCAEAQTSTGTAPSLSTPTSQTPASSIKPGAVVTAQVPVPSGTGQPAQLPEITVVGQLDQSRQEIVPSLGATVYTIDQQEIQNMTAGDNIPLSKLVLRFT
jgi:hypothetical protein